LRGRAVIAPDKFKGSLTAQGAARAIQSGFSAALPELTLSLVPMADGGEGTVDAFVESGWQRVTRHVCGPLGDSVEAAFACDGERAVVEMAEASGLACLPDGRRDALGATSYGTGELIRAALDLGARRIVVAVGGSATNDAGAGLLAALGARFLDVHGVPVAAGGAALINVASIDLAALDPRLRETVFDVAADVDNPLTGPLGASAVFGPQKGASPADVLHLDTALERFAQVTAGTLGEDVRDEPGAGAAGGLGFALRAYVRASLRPGIALVAELRGLPALLAGAVFCATGEGCIDAQTLGGKTVDGVGRLARAAGVPTIAFAGRVDAEAERELAARGVVVVPIAAAPVSAAEAMENAAALLERAAFRAGRLLALA
jgi:glycerate kinase